MNTALILSGGVGSRLGTDMHLILADHGGSSVLRYHKTGVQTGIGHQKFGQTTQSHNELCHPSLGNVT